MKRRRKKSSSCSYVVWARSSSGKNRTLKRFRSRKAAGRFAKKRSMGRTNTTYLDKVCGRDEQPLTTFHGGRAQSVDGGPSKEF